MEAEDLRQMSCDVLECIQITKKKVLVVLKHIADKSPGSDQMHPWTLWEARGNIVEAFTSSPTSELPQGWRMANVVLFF